MTEATELTRYIGTKIIHAKPMVKNYGSPEDQGQPGYQVVYPDGYTSWSPAKAFEDAYRPCDAMPFGLAIEALKAGHCVARTGWNGKGMWLSYVASDSYSLNNPNYVAHPEFDGEPHLLPWIGMKTADNGFVPWFASQTDVLAEDWVVLEATA